MVLNDMGSLTVVLSIGRPCLAIWMDLRRGAHEDEMDDMVGRKYGFFVEKWVLLSVEGHGEECRLLLLKRHTVSGRYL